MNNPGRILAVATFTLLLYGCSSGSESNGPPANSGQTGSAPNNQQANIPQTNNPLANNPLANNQAEGGSGSLAADPAMEQADWGSDRVAQSKPGFKRGKLLVRPEPPKPQQPQVDPYAAKYDRWRLDRAATIRNWAQVTMIPHGIDAFLHTVWLKGVCHVRLALLGPGDNLRIFTRDHQSVKMSFQDQDGQYLQSMTIPMSMFKEASQGTNGGTPTYFVEGQLEVPLESYERYYQWVFEWE